MAGCSYTKWSPIKLRKVLSIVWWMMTANLLLISCCISKQNTSVYVVSFYRVVRNKWQIIWECHLQQTGVISSERFTFDSSYEATVRILFLSLLGPNSQYCSINWSTKASSSPTRDKLHIQCTRVVLHFDSKHVMWKPCYVEDNLVWFGLYSCFYRFGDGKSRGE